MFINEARWVRGAVPFEGDVGSYRQYVINHEVGHAIGYLRHEPCDQQGGLAPVMMQQTFSTSNDDAAKFDPDFVKADGKTCRFNPWPYPIPLTRGSKGGKLGVEVFAGRRAADVSDITEEIFGVDILAATS